MRTQKSFKNILSSIVPYFFLTFLGFLRLKVMLNSLGDELYALNQVFIQIFSYISLLEAGVGTLITQLYYKHFANLNKKKICEIYSYSKNILKRISIIMIIVGIVISFLLKIFTNNNLSLLYMQFVFILYLFRSVLEYIMYAPRFVITADQKAYKINLVSNIFKIFEMIFEILLLLIYQNYVLILIFTIIVRYITYYISNKIVYKEYPWLKCVETHEKLKVKEMGAVMTHKLAGTVYSNTDILLASTFLNPIYVVIYSSYNYIIKFINDVVYMVGSSITASMGNVLYKDDDNQKYEIFEKINSVFIFFAMLFTFSLYVCTSPFVKLWLGEEKVTSNLTLMFMVLTLFFSITSRPFLIIRDSKALYSKTKAIAILEAILNLLLSFILVRSYNIVGLLIPTLISTILTTVIFYPIFIYKNVFKKSCIKYFIKLVLSFIFVIALCYWTKLLKINFGNSYINWFLVSVLIFIFSVILLFVYNIIINPYFYKFVKELVSRAKGMIIYAKSIKKNNK